MLKGVAFDIMNPVFFDEQGIVSFHAIRAQAMKVDRVGGISHIYLEGLKPSPDLPTHESPATLFLHHGGKVRRFTDCWISYQDPQDKAILAWGFVEETDAPPLRLTSVQRDRFIELMIEQHRKWEREVVPDWTPFSEAKIRDVVVQMLVGVEIMRDVQGWKEGESDDSEEEEFEPHRIPVPSGGWVAGGESPTQKLMRAHEERMKAAPQVERTEGAWRCPVCHTVQYDPGGCSTCARKAYEAESEESNS